jgi:2-methylcitrate dehydratase
VAVALHDGRVTLHSFGAKRLQDSALAELIKKIRVVADEEFVNRYPAAMPTRITIRTREGKAYTKQKDLPLGHPGNPMSDREVEAKFRSLVRRRLGRARTERLIQSVWQLDRLNDIGTLMPLMKVNA